MANSLAEEAGLGARPIHCVWLVQCNSIKHHRDRNPACWSPVRLAGRNNGELLRLHVPVDMHVEMECSSEPFWKHCTSDAYLAWRVRCCLSAEDVENVDVNGKLICYAHTHTRDYYHGISAKSWPLTFVVKQPQNRFSVNNTEEPRAIITRDILQLSSSTGCNLPPDLG